MGIKKNKIILIVLNVDWFFISHRLAIAEKAIEDGFTVFVACEDTGRSGEIKKLGINFIDFRFTRSGTNLFEELKTVHKFFKLYIDVKPDIVHHITIKPLIYGSIIAKILNIQGVVNAIAGLGYNFSPSRRNLFSRILSNLLRIGFNRRNLAIIFQNDNDFEDLNKGGIVSPKNSIFFTKGSGVDLNLFEYSEPSNSNNKITILFPTRMLWEKGVKELIDSSEILRLKYDKKIRFIFAGLADNNNKSGVSEIFLNQISDGEYLQWIGYQKNIIQLYKDSDIVVLPSYYREGIPKSLIEACAIGRPIVTTDSVGCKECVVDGKNGFKVIPKMAIPLADAIEKLIINKELRIKMGKESRLLAEKLFDVKLVIDTHLEIYNSLIKK